MKLSVLKVLLSVIVVSLGLFLGVSFTGDYSSAGDSTLTLDFGNYEINSTNSASGNAIEALNSMCEEYGYLVTYDENHNVQTINGQPGVGDSRTWGLYTLSDSTWVKYTDDPTTLKLSGTSMTSWALCESSGAPTPVVDASGHTYYGFGEVKTIVCLAPSCTETVCALGGEDLIVGTDFYSNYPSSIQYKRTVLHTITDTGTYTTPSYEIIVKLNPDLVIGIASQNSHVKTIEKLRSVGIQGLVTYDGEDLRSVYNNTYMVGVAMGIAEDATKLTQRLEEEVEQTYSATSGISDRPSIMTALSINKSPYVAGSYTYINDIYSKSGATNAFSDINGWRQASSEKIVEYSPQVIIVMSEDEVLESEYEEILNSLPEEWKTTEAYANGDIYIMWGSANDMLSRPSTRLAQVAELLGRLLHEDAFLETITIPKIVGNNYTDYLTYSKEL